MSEGFKFPQYAASIVSSIGALMAGLALGWSSPVEIEVKSGSLGFKVSDDEFSWVAGTLPLGAAVACIPAGFLIDLVGRKTLLCALPIVFMIGWLLIQFAKYVWMLYVGRIILGMASGAVCAAIPAYIGEIAQKEIRGICGTVFQTLLTLGVVVLYLIGAYLKCTPVNYFCIGVCVIQFVSMLFMPESPTFLLEKNKEEKAIKALQFLRGKDYEIKPELDTIKAFVAQHLAEKKSFFAGFNNRACLRALYITLGLMFFQQFSGIKVIIFFATNIFEEAGSSLEPRFGTIIVGAIGCIATFISGFFVDKLGRRLLLMISAITMALSLAVFGFYYYFRQQNEKSVEQLGWIPITALCVYYIMYSFGFGPVPWVMIGELFTADVRGPAGAIAATSFWLFAFIISKLYGSVKNLIGIGETFFVFAIISVIAFVFTFFFVIETKGKSLLEIQNMLSRKKSEPST